MTSHSRRKFLNCLYIGLLNLFILAGIDKVPFHGDEATIIHMSKDWYRLVQQGNLSEVLYNFSPRPGKSTEDQELRILNGTVSKFTIGLGGLLAGFDATKINDDWAWGLDWWENLYYGHLPEHTLLYVSRLSSTWLLWLSVAAVFKIAYRLQGKFTAYLASLIYTLTPSVLLNARRAMFEGANLLGITLVLLAGIELAIVLNNRHSQPNKVLNRWLWFGLAAGFALSAKHINILTIAAVGIGLIWIEHKRLLHLLKYASGSIIVAVLTFLALNPTWWNAPLQVPREVLRLRQNMLSVQANEYGQYDSFGSRLTALVNLPLGSLQYEEDAKFDWSQWIGDQIAAYESSLYSGITWSNLGLLFDIILAIGIIALFQSKKRLHYLVGIFTVIIFFSILITNQLPWQRYYLPLTVPLVLLLALGINRLYVWLVPHVFATIRARS